MEKTNGPGLNQATGIYLKPAGTPVGKLFDKIQKPLKPVAENVFTAIGKIHGLPPLSTIDLVQVNSTNFDGEFEYYKLGRGIRIKISSNAVNKEFALLHEIGHFIDNQALGVIRVNASEAANGTLKEVIKSLSETNTIKSLAQMQKTGKCALLGKMRKLTDNQLLGVKYLLRPQEQWARAYSQYIALKCIGNFLRDQLAWEVNDNEIIPKQWTGDDLKNVILAIDNLLIERGWSTLI